MTERPGDEANGKVPGARQRADVLDLVDAAFRYAFSLTHHRQDAEDIAQQACLQILRNKGTVTEKSYLFVAIRNLFLDGCRRRARVTFAQLPEEPHEGQSEVPQIDDKLDLAAILGTLSSDDRELMYLNCIEGFTAQEISAITGRPRGTILSQLARAKKKLSDRFRVEAREGNGAP